MSLDTERQFLCPRLIDYLAIVGARYSNNPSRQNTSPHIQVSNDFSFHYYEVESGMSNNGKNICEDNKTGL